MTPYSEETAHWCEALSDAELARAYRSYLETYYACRSEGDRSRDKAMLGALYDMATRQGRRHVVEQAAREYRESKRRHD